ncbi:MAG: hypothetical protein DRP83_02530 [Planctomycetota bacterium]|nr:MAG: hypothetical protein DRP83_02530 [Planctomycetota bacterium]
METILMPKLAGACLDGTVVRWHKEPGQAFAEGDALARVETEVAFVELTSGLAGVLQRILVPPGSTAAVGEAIAEISPEGQGGQPGGNDDDTNTQANTQDTSREIDMSSDKAAGDVVAILMPQVGNDMEEGTIVKWRVALGDTIAVGDVIFDVETDKATIEVEADKAGRLAKIVAGEDQTVPIKEPVAYLGEDDAAVDAYIAAQAKADVAQSPPAVSGVVADVAQSPPAVVEAAGDAQLSPAGVGSSGGRVKASPAARKLAAELGADLAGLAGTGPGGRIVTADVSSAPRSVGAGLPAASDVAPARAVSGPVGEPTRTKLAGMRKAIAANLTKSKQNIPHFYLRISIDAEAMMTFYRSQKARFKCSVNDVVLMACGRAMHEFPAFRSRLEGDEVVELPSANIGLAVGLDNGLVVPVMQDVDRLSFQQVAGESKRLAEAARGGKVENMGKGSFTITNLGMFGVEEFSAIINPPESAILAVGAAREAVIVRDGAMKPGRVMTATLSCDHRIIDGMLAAKFAARLKELLENPMIM